MGGSYLMAIARKALNPGVQMELWSVQIMPDCQLGCPADGFWAFVSIFHQESIYPSVAGT